MTFPDPQTTDPELKALKDRLEQLEGDYARLRRAFTELDSAMNPLLAYKTLDRVRVHGLEIGRDFFRGQEGSLQLKTPTPASADVPAIHWLNDFSNDPDSVEPYAKLEGRADPSTATFPNGIFTYRLEALNGERFSRLRHTVVADGSAAQLLEFWHGGSAPTQELEYGQLYLPGGGGVHWHRFLGGTKVQFSSLPIELGSFTSDPADGTLWYRSDLSKIRGRLGATAYNLAVEGALLTLFDGTAHRLFYTDGSGNVTELAHGTSGQVLTANGTTSAPSWQDAGGGMDLVVKPSDETISSNATLQNDDALLFAVGANEKWQFEGFIFWNSGATPDFQLTFAGPAGSVGVFFVDPTLLTPIGVDEAELGTALAYGGSTAAHQVCRFWGAIANGGTGGNLQLQWAQNTSYASNTTVHAGSYLKYQKQA